MTEPILVVDKLEKRFGGVQAIRELSFAVHSDEVVGLIGPNGSGKSTSINVISGVFPPTSGNISLCGRSITRLPINDRVSLGLARTFQTTTLFMEYGVFEQVLTACHTRFHHSILSAILRLAGSRFEEIEQAKKVQEILEFVGIGHVIQKPTSTLSSAEQRLLMIATALAGEPKVLLLDEPAAGMVAEERKALGELITRIRDRNISVLVIEHQMSLIMEVCDRIVVLNFGEKIAEGVPAEIRCNQAVIAAYLGKED
jgi:branched-chain amino acid transport system ATP-binding protein